VDQFELHASEKVPNTSYSVCQDRKGTCPINRLYGHVIPFLDECIGDLQLVELLLDAE
jgi:hypothetical protein